MSEIHSSFRQRGLAIGLDGELMNMPRDLAHAVSHDLLNVVTLLHACRREAGEFVGALDDDGVTDTSSRTIALIAMADEKVRGVLHAIEPYV